jgi:hypothetical protein
MKKINLERIGITIVLLVSLTLLTLMGYQIITDCYSAFIK